MERKVHRVHAFAFKEVGRVFERLLRCIPGQRQHVLFALNQATAAITLRRVGTGAAITGVEFAMPLGEDFVDVFFDDPRRAHPPAWHLVNNHVGPQVFFDFFGHVVAFVDVGDFDFKTLTIKKGQRGVVHGQVVAAIRVGEFFSAIE